MSSESSLEADLMQPFALTVDRLLTHAAAWHPTRPIVSRRLDGSVARTTFSALETDARRISGALLASGIQRGDRIATLAMNGADHLAAWFGIMGIGAVCHTVNPRLFDEQLIYILNHAADRWLFADPQFAPLVARLRPHLPALERVVYLCDEAALPPASGDALSFERLLGASAPAVRWGEFDEHSPAALCYTSGTTGHPKGVLYSHRSQVLHTLVIQTRDGIGLSARDTLLVVVPMFHVNAWGMPFAAAAAGCGLVLPGMRLDAASLYELLEREQVTVSAAVPTIWQQLFDHLQSTGLRLHHLKRVVIGGSACPESLIRGFQEGHGVEVVHAWGMTEMSPLGTIGSPTAAVASADASTRLRYSLKQGRVSFGVDLKITDEAGTRLPQDGQRPGLIKVRGPAIIARYFRSDETVLDSEGFFDTGDIGTIDEQGYLEITDRAKDLIKSGGEWISSVEIENLAVAHPAVRLAAVIAIPHERWRERPLLVVERQPDVAVDGPELLEFLKGKIATWWLPDAVVFIEQMPLGATGKLDKKVLRTRFADFKAS